LREGQPIGCRVTLRRDARALNPCAVTTASFGVLAAPPAGTATPKRGRSIFAWYSWIFTCSPMVARF
jgi:hypothetical protein